MLYKLFMGLGVGLLFGIAFEKSKVFEAASIIGQLLFKRFIMLKVLMTAMGISMVVLAGMKYFGLFEFSLKELNFYSNILGGCLLGAGIAFSGACPGTVFAQLGVGYKDAYFTLFGGLVAAFGYSFFNNAISNFFNQWSLGKITLLDLTGLSYITIVLIIGVIFTMFLLFLEKIRPWKKELLT